MSINSRDKGARFERDLAAKLRAHGFADSVRGQQYCGLKGNADVIGVPGIHIEAKHQEKLCPYDWMEQSKRDAKEGEIPIVVFKRNRHEVLVQLRFDDFMRLYKEGGTFGDN